MQSKPQCHKPYISLKQLPISEQPWNSIFIDFIKKLLSSSRFDTILVIVNQLTKQAIFISAHDTITSMDLVCLFILHVFSKYNISSHVTSDRNLEFMEYPQSRNLCSSTALSGICWCVMFPCSWFQSRWQILCQGSVLLNYSAFKETLWKIPWTLWNHHLVWYTIIHPLSSRVHALCSPSLPCVHTQTHHVQHFL